MHRAHDPTLLSRAETRRRLVLSLRAPPSPSSCECVRSLCLELRGRLQGLTPHRPDLRSDLERGFDVDLLVQMFEHGAVDGEEADRVVSLVFDWVQSLCAPCQDEAVAHARAHVLARPDVAERLAVLIDVAHRVVDDVERLAHLSLRSHQHHTGGGVKGGSPPSQ